MMPSISNDTLRQTGLILIVDDEPHNRELLRDLLSAKGHRVLEVPDGLEALREVDRIKPDVILLDVMMPILDGFEVCRRLKANPATAAIPVLLVTSVTDRKTRLAGIESGANDFLTKPIDTEDVVLRVRNALVTKRLYDRLNESYDRLRELEELRQNLIDMIVHDLRSPLTGMKGYLDLLQMNAAERLTPKDLGYLELVLSMIATQVEMISSILDVSRLEAGQMPLDFNIYDLGGIARYAVKSQYSRIELKKLRLTMTTPVVRCRCDAQIIGRVILNLVTNAVRFTPENGGIAVSVAADNNHAKVIVTDTGPGIAAEHHEKVFEKFAQLRASENMEIHSTGLGLTFCKLAVEAHGGTMGIASVMGKGSEFWFTLPDVMENSNTEEVQRDAGESVDCRR